MKNKQFFIHTSDDKTAAKLRDLGFQELPKEGTHWVFINDANKIRFSNDDEMKINFTDKLVF